MARMTPEQAVGALLAVPYVLGQGNWAGADCWGLVELWYRHVLGIELDERAERSSARQSIDAWSASPEGWEPVSEPSDHALVLMRSGRLAAGHIGIFCGGRVLHTAADHGCVYQLISDRIIRSTVTGYLRRS